MKHALALPVILLLACASSASAEPPAPKAPARADACRPGGKAVFEIDHRVTPGAAGATSTIQVFGSGAWTRQAAEADGKAQPATSGCLDQAYARQLATALRAAPWKITTARLRCMAMSTEYTDYKVDDKVVFTQKLCSGQTLDDKSRAVLDDAVAHCEAAAKPAP